MGLSLERIGIYAIAALLPLERIGAISLGGANIRPSQLALVLTLLFVLKTVLHKRDFEWRRPEYLLLIIFIGFNVSSLFNAENFPRSFTVLIYTVFTATLAVVIPVVLRKKEHFLVVRNVIFVSAAAVGLFGLWQFLGDMAGLSTSLTGLRPQYTKAILGFTRIQSIGIEPLYFANYLLLPIGLLLTTMLSFRPHTFVIPSLSRNLFKDSSTPPRSGRDDQKKHIALYALLALLLVNFLLTASRGGYLALIAMTAVIAWMYRKKILALKRLFLVGLTGIVLAFLAVQALAAYNVTTPGSLADTFLGHISTVTSGAAYDERVETFERSIRAFEMHPLIGIGIGGYGPFSAIFPGTKPGAGWAIVNNEPLELLAETGIMGLAAMIAFLGYLLYIGSKKLPPAISELEPIRIGTFAALIGIIVQYQTFSTLYIMHVWFAIGLLVATSRFKRFDE